MVQVYVPGNENFSQNGDYVLFCERCDLTVELNGVWTLDLTIPLDIEGRWKYVTEHAVLKVPTWQDNEQLYRIEKVVKTEEGLSATAYPIFYDSAKDCFLMDCRPTAKTGQQALDIMTEGTPYSGSSNITAGNTAYFVRRNLMSAIMGNEEPTFLSRWGGEVLFDNYTVIVNNRVGGDYGAEARYGLNIAGSEYTVDTSELCTRIVPVSFNGHMISGSTPWVDSARINSYPNVYIREIRYEHIKLATDIQGRPGDSDIVCETQAELETALVAAAQADFAAGCDLPTVTMDIDMVAIRNQRLKQTEPVFDISDEEILDTLDDELFTVFYQSYKTLEDIRLGDTVHCRHYKLDITSVSRVVGLTWDCLRKCVTHITLGQFKQDYVQIVNNAVTRINSVTGEDGSLIAEKVRGFLDGAETQFRAQYNLAERSDVLAILFENFDSTSEMYGATGIGTQGVSISKTRTQDGRGWEWTAAITANGINAGVGVFGLLADKEGNNYINLDTGAVHFGDETNYLSFDPETGNLDLKVSSFSVAGNSIETIAQSKADAALLAAQTYTNALNTSLNQQEVFNRLTNNGQSQGIYLRTDDDDKTRLYINASYIASGTISADRIAADSIDATKLNVTNLSTISANLGEITGGSINIGNGAFVVTSAGALTATSGSFSGTIQAGTYLGLPGTGMSVTATGGLQGTTTAGYTGSVLSGSSIGALPVTATGLSYTNGGSTMSFDTSGLKMGTALDLGVAGTGKISNIVVDTNAIYSTGHTTYSSSTRGFYLGASGSFGVGDDTNYIHFDSVNGRLDMAVTSFSLAGSSVETIAENKAGAALTAAKTYADGVGSTAVTSANGYTDGRIRDLPTPEALTQQNVFNALTNNGETQGIWLRTDTDNKTRVYINASYIASGTIAADRIGANSITAGKLDVTTLSAISANLGTITAGSISIGSGNTSCTIDSSGKLTCYGAEIRGTCGNGITFDGNSSTIRLNGYRTESMINGSNGSAVFGELVAYKNLTVGELLSSGAAYGNIKAYGIIEGAQVKVEGTEFSTNQNCTNNLYGTTKLYNVAVDSSATNVLCFDHIDGATVRRMSASSRRYKDIARNLTSEDIKSAWKIQPVLAKYKDGYLMETDERNRRYLPMFIAEDVEKYVPEAADHNGDGCAEDWNYRFMIPVMFQMIKSLKEEVEVLKYGKV